MVTMGIKSLGCFLRAPKDCYRTELLLQVSALNIPFPHRPSLTIPEIIPVLNFKTQSKQDLYSLKISVLIFPQIGKYSKSTFSFNCLDDRITDSIVL
jgi:hypothetical protein